MPTNLSADQDKFDDPHPEFGYLSRLEADQEGNPRRFMRSGQKMSVNERLDYAVKFVPKADWRDRFGRSDKQIDRYLSGDDIPLSILKLIARASHIPVEWLVAGVASPQPFVDRTSGFDRDGKPYSIVKSENFGKSGRKVLEFGVTSPKSEAAPAGYAAVPRYNITASAGSGSAPSDHNQVVDYFAFSEEFLRRHLHRRVNELALIEARGNSMEPSIHDGDILIVDVRPSPTIDNGRLYVLRVDNDLLVKRLERRMDGSLTVHSDNPRYAPDTISRANMDSLQIIGRVMMVTTPPR